MIRKKFRNAIVIMIMLSFVWTIIAYAKIGDEINTSNIEKNGENEKESCNDISGKEKPEEEYSNLRAANVSGQWIQASDGRWWYKHNDGTYTSDGWEYIDGQWYYFDAAGWMKTGWLQLNGQWYYLSKSGAMVKDWYLIDGDWYYFSSLGVMNNKNMTDHKYGAPRTLYFLSSGKWLYTVSLCGWDLVDSGKHLDWGSGSKYLSYINTAVNKWNAYKPGIIRKDDITIVEDVTISDFTEISERWGYATSLGTIHLNTYKMDAATSTYNDRLNTIMHEFGHALGLGHNDPQDVMAVCSDIITLTTNDKRSYDAAYETY